MVYRIFVEKRPGLSPEAANLLSDLKKFLGIANLYPNGIALVLIQLRLPLIKHFFL